jgi:UTP--glucose-1-phosphate uridylyltransferase
VRSDCFVYSEREGLKLNPARESAGRTEAIKIKLDPKYYGKFDLLEERFKEGEPSLVECDALSINGDVRFEKGVVIRGSVTITNPGASPAVVKAGTVIDRDLVL